MLVRVAIYGDEMVDVTADTWNNVFTSEVRTTKNWEKVAKDLGIPLEEASRAIHDAKRRTGRGGADNVEFDPKTGDIIDPKSGEVIGNLGDYD